MLISNTRFKPDTSLVCDGGRVLRASGLNRADRCSTGVCWHCASNLCVRSNEGQPTVRASNVQTPALQYQNATFCVTKLCAELQVYADDSSDKSASAFKGVKIECTLITLTPDQTTFTTICIGVYIPPL